MLIDAIAGAWCEDTNHESAPSLPCPGTLIDPADRLRIEAAVIEAAQRTLGESGVVVARACDEYGSAGWRLGAALSAASLLALVWLVGVSARKSIDP